MRTSIPRRAAVAALLIAAATGAAHAAPAVVVESVSFVPFIDGGVGKAERADLASAASGYNLRLRFSERKSNELAADVSVLVRDAQGDVVFALDDAGPMTDVRLPPGRYQVTAALHGQPQERTVVLGGRAPQAVDFHWKGTPKSDPWDGRPMGGREIPG